MKKQIVSMKRGAQKGFTLIELMIVVAIIGILAAFAVPMFQDYTVRTRVGEGLVLASTYKNLVVDNAVNGFPLNQGAPTFTATTNTASISVSTAGVITITSSPSAENIKLLLTPYAIYNTGTGAGSEEALRPNTTAGSGGAASINIPQGRISWKCTVDGTTTSLNKIPSECRG